MNQENKTRYRVLIVDDEPTNIKILSNILQDDYDISAATNGQDALKIAAELQPKIILLDILMPGMTGDEVCKQLLENEATSNIPVIFVTSLDDEINETLGFKAGAVDYIRKPITPLIVKARVKVHLHNYLYLQFLESLLEQGIQSLAKAQEEAKELLQLNASFC